MALTLSGLPLLFPSEGRLVWPAQQPLGEAAGGDPPRRRRPEERERRCQELLPRTLDSPPGDDAPPSPPGDAAPSPSGDDAPPSPSFYDRAGRWDAKEPQISPGPSGAQRGSGEPPGSESCWSHRPCPGPGLGTMFSHPNTPSICPSCLAKCREYLLSRR